MNDTLQNLSRRALIEQVKVLQKSKIELEESKEELQETKDKYEQEVNWYKHQLAQLRRLMYGAKRERFIASKEQMTLPFEVAQEQVPEPPREKISYNRQKTTSRKNHPGRHALPSHLRVEETIIEPENIPEGSKKIGEEVRDVLEYKPCELYINRTIRPKYSLGKEAGVVIAELPSRPIEKCMAGNSLLSQVMVDKFVDHLPIHRQIQRYKRLDVTLAASSLNSWQESVCQLLFPLYEELQRQVLGEGYLQVDETPIKVLDKQKKGKTHQGYYWVYHSPIRKVVLFDYRKGRNREGPKEMLRDFKGYLQTDGYNAYDWFSRVEGITMVGCMAHARRYFEQALDNDKARGDYVLTQIQQLYAIECSAKEAGIAPQQRHLLRLDESLPILNELGKWMADEYKKVVPKSAMGKALGYAINRWDNLLNYLKDGHLEMDNNGVENAIRPNALGRKNYLFAGSHNGARRAAMMYSFFGTCKMNDVNPYQWLKHVLDHIADHKIKQIQQLLPYNF